MTFLAHEQTDADLTARSANSHFPADAAGAHVKVRPGQLVPPFAVRLLGVGRASFVGTVAHVVGLSPASKVCGIETTGVVASVKNDAAFSQRNSKVKHSYQAMDADGFAANADHAVSGAIAGAVPYLAIVHKLQCTTKSSHWKVVR
jgi:hypothetical protein